MKTRSLRLPAPALVLRLVLLPLALLWTVGCDSETPPTMPPALPNVLILSLDTLRPDHLGVYGYSRDTSPALDAFAADGVVFERAYAPAPSTVPSHATLFTGLLPSQHRTTTYRHTLPEAAVTLADRFGDAGYRTFAASSSTRFGEESGFHQGFDHWQRFDDLPKNERSEAVTDAALEHARPSAVAGQTDEPPFFGFLHYFGPHEPYAPPEPFRSRWHPGLEHPIPENTSEYLQAHKRPEADVPPEILEYLEALYDGEILFLDRELGRLFEGLEEAGLADDTLVVILSDHGEGFRENGRLSHSDDLNEELLRIPLIVRRPSTLAPGRSRLAVGLVDVLPTVLELAGIEAPTALAGRSVAHVLLDGSPDEPSRDDPQIVVAQMSNRWTFLADTSAGRFKLEIFKNGRERLFHLDRDPWGSRDVHAEHPRVVEEVKALANAYFAGPGRDDLGGLATTDTAPRPKEEVDPEILERLRAIGYADEIEPRANEND